MQNKKYSNKVLKKILLGLFLPLFFLPFVASAQDEAAFGGTAVREQTRESLGNPGERDPRDIAASIINITFGFLGLIAISLILYAGYLWMTSQGNPEKIDKAKQILKNTAIGILIILSAWAIVLFIFRMFFGGGSGGEVGGGGGRRGMGIGALGNGILSSVYPAPNQTDVPRNTAIIVTFREPIDPKTICNTAGSTCNNDLIATSSKNVPNIRIYYTQNALNCEKSDGNFDAQACGKIFNAKVFSDAENKTFVFKPTEYLGSMSEFIWHTVYLTKNIKKANGDDAFRSYDGVKDLSWSFEVSNKLDLDPPQVVAGGLWPASDNLQDQALTSNVSKRAQAVVEIKGTLPMERKASVLGVKTTTNSFEPSVKASINSDCTETGISVFVNKIDNQLLYSAKSSSTGSNLGQGRLSDDNKSVKFDTCGLVLSPDPSYGLIDNAEGHTWKVFIEPFIPAARLAIGNRTYTASTSQESATLQFKSWSNLSDTAINLANLINNDADSAVTASTSGNKITVYAKTFGIVGNEIKLSSTDNLIFLASDQLTGGEDAKIDTKIKGRKDKPRNSIIQINFNEAMNPIILSGSSSQIANYIRIVNASPTAKANGSVCISDNECMSLSCKKAANAQESDAGTCEGSYLPGVFKIANQYKTAEFTSNHQCGVNGCGQKIYCLPGDANIKVEMFAANLDDTDKSTNDCAKKQPFVSYSGLVPAGFKASSSLPYNVCQTSSTTNPVDYPTSKLGGTSPFDGLMDAAFNSLDGNRDASAQGPFSKTANSFYKENSVWGYCVNNENTMFRSCSNEIEGICGLGGSCYGASSTAAAKLYGDNYNFSFWTNNEILAGAPKISQLENIGIKDGGISLSKPAIMDFDRVMSVSSLSTGRASVQVGTSTTGTTTEHRMMNIGSFSKQPVGYWGSSESMDTQPDGEMDWTKAYINHTDFDPSTDYWAEGGSGILDINQNCYKPSNGPASSYSSGNCGANPDQPTCCNGSSRLSANCDGNLK